MLLCVWEEVGGEEVADLIPRPLLLLYFSLQDIFLFELILQRVRRRGASLFYVRISPSPDYLFVQKQCNTKLYVKQSRRGVWGEVSLITRPPQTPISLPCFSFGSRILLHPWMGKPWEISSIAVLQHYPSHIFISKMYIPQ